MKTLKIKSADFINWYFNSGSDQEQKEMIMSVGKVVSQGLLKGEVTITPQEIFDVCSTDIIPLNLVKGYENSKGEIGDVFDKFEVVLI